MPDYAEVNEYFQKRMEESRSVWAKRGKEARIAAYNQRLAEGPKTWRQMKGMPLIIHEIKHVGNRPFMWGFLTIALGTVYVQTKFTDEMRANSDYWQTFHGSGKPKAH
eukprot:CAMPEP_0113569908 /NCGR_PEP_ID=MMETSP0015_2-20120614/24672_1 /TAXON_ID=2838 /ORGANISM="Odontella" /LENGTH=107 /DNA_ID=CAMNT_0000472625 /DNA_START=54 /DNA_END=377 /DNA_ORIENTATION=+ /assembly_acc=CAM_ASM_000160